MITDRIFYLLTADADSRYDKNRNGMLIFHKNVVDLHTVSIFTFKQK